MTRSVASALLVALTAGQTASPPPVLSATATAELARSLDSSNKHRSHVWRDTASLNADGTLNAYVEIARGDRRKLIVMTMATSHAWEHYGNLVTDMRLKGIVPPSSERSGQ